MTKQVDIVVTVQIPDDEKYCYYCRFLRKYSVDYKEALAWCSLFVIDLNMVDYGLCKCPECIERTTIIKILGEE